MATARPGTAGGGRSLLRDSVFVRLWVGTTASGLATWALPFVLGLAVLEGSLDPIALGVVLATRTVGFIVSMPVGGVLADRYPRRLVIRCAGLAATLAAPALAFGMGRSLLLMAIAAAIMGAGQGACRPAFQALTGEVVEEERRQQANAAITFAVRGTTMIAPSLTALLVLFVAPWGLIVGIGGMWLLAAVITPGGRDVSDMPGEPAPRSSFFAEFADGLREARRHPWFLAGLGALTAVIATGYSATGVALPLVSGDRYDTELVLAAATTGYTVGALLGAVLIARWRPRARGWAALAGLAVYGFAPLCLLLPVHPALLVLAYVLAGVGIELFNVPWFTAVQREVDPKKLARVSSIDFLFSYGLAPVGLVLIAPAMQTFGVTPTLAACAAVCFVAPALAALVPSTRDFERPRDSEVPAAGRVASEAPRQADPVS